MGILKGTIKTIHSSINSIGGGKGKKGGGGKKKTPGAGLLRGQKIRMK